MSKSYLSSEESRHVIDAFVYPDEKKEMDVGSLVILAKADGERKWKRNVKVVDFIWSEVCKLWVVIIETKEGW